MADSKFKAMMNSLSSNSTILRELSPEENQSLKNELVQMFQEILAVCQKHGLTIMLGGGQPLPSAVERGAAAARSCSNYNEFVVHWAPSFDEGSMPGF